MAVWATADLHGHLEIWEKIKKIIGDDEIYVLGDCVDRGPQSWETLKAVYNDPHAHLIKGNHEDMLVKACEDYLADDYMWDYHSYSLCRMNGGEDTMLSWERDPDREMWLRRLRDLPTWDTYEVGDKCYVLCHAGFTPWYKVHTKECFVPTDRMLIWDREHYLEEWVDGEMDDDIIVVHGHTPIHHLSEDLRVEWESGAFWYCDDHKVCIDSGGFFSGEWVLLNIDTGEDIVLTLDK